MYKNVKGLIDLRSSLLTWVLKCILECILILPMCACVTQQKTQKQLSPTVIFQISGKNIILCRLEIQDCMNRLFADAYLTERNYQ